VTRRDVARLLPLLALYLAALAFFPAHPDDEASYVDLAHRLAHGWYVTGDNRALLDPDPSSPDLWFGPGLPGLLAPLAALDVPLRLMRVVGPLVLFGGVLLFYALLRRRWEPPTPLLGAYALGLYPPFWPLLTNLHSEPLAVALVAGGMLGLALHLERPRASTFVLAAGSFAGLALTRVAYGWVLTVVLIASLVWWLGTRSSAASRTALVVAAALLACTPWLAYTQRETGRVYQWGNSGALSLYWMSSPYPGDRGDWRQADDVFTDPALARHAPFFAGLRGLSLGEQNARIERRALRNIAHRPDRYAENVGANLGRMFLNVPYSDEPWQWNDVFYAAPNLLVAIVVVVSALVLVPRRRLLPPETGPFLLIAGAGFLLHAALAAYPRMLAPLMPLVVWFAVLAATTWARERGWNMRERSVFLGAWRRGSSSSVSP